MKFDWMKTAVPVVMLAASSFADTATTSPKVVVEPSPTPVVQMRAPDAREQELMELRKQVDELKRSLADVREQLANIPRASLDDSTGS